MLNEFILDATWSDWVLISSFALIVITIANRYGFFEWLESVCTKKTTKFITFKEALDYCIDFREETGVSIDIINYYKERDQDFLSFLYAHPEQITMVDLDLSSLLHLIKQNEITLYGQRTETIKNIRRIDLEKIDKDIYLNVKNWSKDLNSLYDNDQLLYTNLCFKQKDINSLIERGKLSEGFDLSKKLKEKINYE